MKLFDVSMCVSKAGNANDVFRVIITQAHQFRDVESNSKQWKDKYSSFAPLLSIAFNLCLHYLEFDGTSMGPVGIRNREKFQS